METDGERVSKGEGEEAGNEEEERGRLLRELSLRLWSRDEEEEAAAAAAAAAVLMFVLPLLRPKDEPYFLQSLWLER